MGGFPRRQDQGHTNLGFEVMAGTIHEMEATRRQRIIQALEERTWELDDLRRELELSVRGLEEELRHVERTVRPRGRRLQIESARCLECGFQLASRALHPPGRCPRCRNRRIRGPWLSIA